MIVGGKCVEVFYVFDVFLEYFLEAISRFSLQSGLGVCGRVGFLSKTEVEQKV